MTWREYIQKTINKKPHELLIKATSLVESTEPKRALDLGAGALGDSKYLASKGYEVTAVDSEESVKYLTSGIPNLTVIVIPMENFVPDGEYDLVNAQYALPFVSKEHFWKVLTMAIGSLKMGGIFCGTFFGPEDEWHNDSTLTFVSKNELEKKLLAYDLDVFYNEEEKGISKTAAGGNKFWHVFHIIARKHIDK